MNKYFDFSEYSALIIGGGSGIGKVIAKALNTLGAYVVIAGRDEEKLKRTVTEINRSQGPECEYFVCDATIEASVKQLAKFISNKFNSKLNILINSAGTNIREPFREITLSNFEEVHDANLKSVFLVTKYMMSFLEDAEFGRVINIASIFSTVSFPDRVSYSSSKGAVLLLSKTIALEYAQKDVTVNTISPGPLLTEINEKVLENKKNYEKFCERIPMKRFGNPEEVVTAALFLASPFSSYVTGSDIIVDGGWTSS